MLAQNTWARRGLYILVSLIVLAGVAVAAYGFGANNAPDGPRAGFIERGPIGDGPQGNRDGGPGQAGPGNQDGQGAPGFGQRFNQDGQNAPRFAGIGRLAGRASFGGLGLLLRAIFAILFVGLLALGAIAFFRTGGWKAQPAEVVDAPAKPETKKKKS